VEFTVDKQAFLSGLYKVQGIVDKKSTVNVLSHVLISAEADGTLQLTATDYDVLIIGRYVAEVLEPGRLAVNARSLFDVVKSLPDRPIQIRKLENNWAEVTSGRSHFKLMGISPADFPEFHGSASLSTIEVPKAMLSAMIDKTAFSVSTDESRLSLNGVFFRVRPSQGGALQLIAVSTDGHRLSKVEVALSESAYDGDPAEAIIHRKGVFELKRMLDGPSPTARVAFVPPNVVFQSEGNTMYVRQIEESFPDYEKVIPAENAIRAVMSRSALSDAIRRIATLTSAKASIIKFDLQADQLLLWSSNPEAGEGRDAIDITLVGQPIAVGFNYKYLLDVLNVLDGTEVVFEINDQFSPGVLYSPDDPAALFVIMPMRI
jgi:DNA polymerase-3 subunit beta